VFVDEVWNWGWVIVGSFAAAVDRAVDKDLHVLFERFVY
jgi:hypothetical protein